MARIHISEIRNYIGQRVTLAGFVQTIRDQGSIKFLILRDITGTVQVVVTKTTADSFAAARALSLESVLAVTGKVKEEKQAPGGVEVACETIVVLSAAAPELPIPIFEKDEHATDQAVRLDWRVLDLRKPKNQLIYQVWTTMEEAFRHFWLEHGYLQIHSPKLMNSPSESGAEVFEVKYFDRQAYLSQSPQFYKQMAMAAGFEKVFEIGPVFRAEPSFTSRHATEFTGYDAEISYIQSRQDIMAELSNLLVSVLNHLKQTHGPMIEQRFGPLTVPTSPFPEVTMLEAKQLLKQAGVSSEREGDLSPEEERRLSELIKERDGHEFVFVTGYPVSTRPFYHMREETDQTITKSFDLLWNGLEITTGAQREHRYEILKKQAKEKSLALGEIEYYLNFFKYGCPPHGGFGLGPERLLLKLLKLENIRDVSYIYRGVRRLTP